MRLAFLGSGAFGLPTLRALVDSEEHEVAAVVTQPDRPAGRGRELTATPIKELARELGLPLRQPEDINREVKDLEQLRPDAVVVAAYGRILSRSVLEVPRRGAINLHASLLPKLRGAAPIPWALIRGEARTGVTTFLMDEGLDTGPILLQREVPIAEDDTAGSLEGRLAEAGAKLVAETLSRLEAGAVAPVPQDEARASWAPKITKEMAKIDWTKGASELFNLIRALNPRPGAYAFYRGRRLKVHFARLASGPREGKPGEITEVGEAGPIVQTGDGTLELIQVQPEGKRSMSGTDFVRGHPPGPGEQLG